MIRIISYVDSVHWSLNRKSGNLELIRTMIKLGNHAFFVNK